MPKPPRAPAPAAPDSRADESRTELPTAGVFRRLAALVYDAFLLFGLLVVPLLVVTAITSPHRQMPQAAVTHELPPIAPKPVLLAYMIAVIVGFYCYFWRRSGQTLGMQAWRMRVESVAGGRLSWRQCLLRAIVGFASLFCAGLGYWWIWLDRDGASWHDRASGTRVIVLQKKTD